MIVKKFAPNAALIFGKVIPGALKKNSPRFWGDWAPRCADKNCNWRGLIKTKIEREAVVLFGEK
jgi:hypothetical protein